jgi:UDP-N-acetylmuramyl pentapeptide phosphotransferase/UDP-N-acetylglucosamine-1-phosphate transferase
MAVLTIPPYATYAMLAGFAALLLYAIFAPQKQPDPQRGMAIGCLIFVLLFLVLVVVLFTSGVLYKIRPLTDGVNGLCLFVIAFTALSLAESAFKRWRAR